MKQKEKRSIIQSGRKTRGDCRTQSKNADFTAISNFINHSKGKVCNRHDSDERAMWNVEADSEFSRELLRSGDCKPGIVQVVPLFHSIMSQEKNHEKKV